MSKLKRVTHTIITADRPIQRIKLLNPATVTGIEPDHIQEGYSTVYCGISVIRMAGDIDAVAAELGLPVED